MIKLHQNCLRLGHCNALDPMCGVYSTPSNTIAAFGEKSHLHYRGRDAWQRRRKG